MRHRQLTMLKLQVKLSLMSFKLLLMLPQLNMTMLKQNSMRRKQRNKKLKMNWMQLCKHELVLLMTKVLILPLKSKRMSIIMLLQNLIQQLMSCKQLKMKNLLQKRSVMSTRLRMNQLTFMRQKTKKKLSLLMPRLSKTNSMRSKQRQLKKVSRRRITKMRLNKMLRKLPISLLRSTNLSRTFLLLNRMPRQSQRHTTK